MKPIIKVGNWARSKGYIGKIINITGRGKDKVVDIETNLSFLDDKNKKLPLSLYPDQIEMAHSKIIKILKPGDFLDTHCIWTIDKGTVFLNEGWFINESDILDMVTTITTQEMFYKGAYKIDEDE